MSLKQIVLAFAFLAAANSVSWGQYAPRYPQPWQPPMWNPYGFGGFNGFNMGQPNNLSLVISQNQDVHDQITNLMDQLRRLQDQQVAVGARFNTLNDNFYERMGVNFGFNLRLGRQIVGLDQLGRPTRDGAIQFRQGGFGVTPPFGGHDPATDATFGYMVRGKKVDGLFNFAFGQGNTRTNTVQQPRVLLYNGVPGTISDSSQRPFVTGVIPVVSNTIPASTQPAVTYTSPIRQLIAQYQQQKAAEAERAAYFRDRGEEDPEKPEPPAKAEAARPAVEANAEPRKEDAPLVLVRNKRESAHPSKAEESTATDPKPVEPKVPDEIRSLLDKAYAAQDAGKNNVAKIYYQQAAARATGELKRDLIEKIKALK